MAKKPSREDCLADLARRTGKKREEVEDLLNEIDDRAEDFRERYGMDRGEAYQRARDEKLYEISEQAALRRRAEILDTRKETERRRFYTETAMRLAKLPGVSEAFAKKLAVRAARLAMEAKLVGVNLPFFKNRMSVDAQYIALRRLWVGGFSRDLEEAGLAKIFASRQLEAKWTDELFELNRSSGGRPGITGDKQALAIAKIVQKWQKTSMAALNREGAWVRSYSGYITRTSHDADLIRRAGPEKWVNDLIDNGWLDLKRTFGTSDRQHARDMLRQMWTPMKDGNHFDYGKPIEEPLYPSVASKVSKERELHFRDGKAWRAYNEQYGVHNATHQVVQAITVAARRTALMKEFGTRPKEAFDADINYIKKTLQEESRAQTAHLDALNLALENKALSAEARARIEKDRDATRLRIEQSAGKFREFESWEQPLRNRFAQIDGTSQRPVNRTMANVISNWMAIQRMAKLGRVALTHFASLPTKSMEASYWGIPFSERYASLFRGLTQGAEGSDKRAVLDNTLVAFENRLGHMMAQYDVADAPAGFLSQWETLFFKLTGVSSVIDNQRGDAEAMFAAHLGRKRGLSWAEVGDKEQRVLQGFGIGEREWKALHGVEWTKVGDRQYLFPSDALKLTDEQVREYIKDQNPALVRAEPTPEDIAKAREDLAATLAATYTDRAGYAIPMPNARIRAMLFGKNFEPGTPINAALRLIYQFKIWPADMITRAWEREIYGRIGDGRMDRVAGVVEAAVACIVFGVAANLVRDVVQGKDGLRAIQEHPLEAMEKGLIRSGFGTIVGDFLLHNFSRHGMNVVEWLAGPTISELVPILDLLHAGSGTKGGMLSAGAMRQRGADLLQLAHDNTPFMNLWVTSLAVDTLIWHRLQEWINPGYLQRREQRQLAQQGQHYWLSPAATDQWLTGRRAAFGADGRFNLKGQ